MGKAAGRPAAVRRDRGGSHPTDRNRLIVPQVAPLYGASYEAVETVLRVVAGVLLFVGSFLDWVQAWMPYRGWYTESAFAHAGDGVFTVRTRMRQADAGLDRSGIGSPPGFPPGQPDT